MLPEKSVKLLTVLNAWLLLYLAFQKKKSKTKIEGAHTHIALLGGVQAIYNLVMADASGGKKRNGSGSFVD